MWKFNGTDFDVAGVTSCVRTLVTGGGDSCTVVLDVDFVASTGLTERSSIVTVLAGDGGTFFVGPVWSISPAASGDSEQVTVELRSYWALLEITTFRQEFKALDVVTTLAPEDGGGHEVTETDKWLSHVYLCQGMDTAAQIDQILDYAADMIPGLPRGAILPGIAMPQFEMSDASCAECILQCLRFHPDAVVYCDYSGSGGGNINVKKRSALGEVEIDSRTLAGEVGVDWTPRTELVPPGVSINYERTHRVDGESYYDVVKDEVGSPEEPGGLHFTIPLEGQQIVLQKQNVVTEDIPEVGGADG